MVLGWIKFYESATSCVVVSVIVCISLLYWIRFLALDPMRLRTLDDAINEMVTLCDKSRRSMCSSILRASCASCDHPLSIHAQYCGMCGRERDLGCLFQPCVRCGHLKLTETRFCEVCKHEEGKTVRIGEFDLTSIQSGSTAENSSTGQDDAPLTLAPNSQIVGGGEQFNLLEEECSSLSSRESSVDLEAQISGAMAPS